MGNFLANHRYAANGYQLNSSPSFGHQILVEQCTHVSAGKDKNMTRLFRMNVLRNYDT